MEQNKPKFFIITPVYCKNDESLERFIECVKSVSNQNDPNAFHLIVDDGSTHPKIEPLLNELEKSEKIIVFRIQNQGLISALNFLKEKLEQMVSDNDYVMRLNADDLLPPDVIKAFQKILDDNNDLAVIFGSAIIFYDTWKQLELVPTPRFKNNHDLWRHLVEHKPLHHFSMIWKAPFYLNFAGHLDPNIKYSEDWDQAVRTAKGLLDTGNNFYVTDKIVYLFRKSDSSLGNKQLSDFKGKISSYNTILKKQIGGTDYYYQSLRNIIRLIRIKIALKFKREWRDLFMPPYSKVVSPGEIDNKVVEVLNSRPSRLV